MKKTLRDWLIVFTAVLAAGGVLLYVEHRATMWEKQAAQIALDLTRNVMDAEKYSVQAIMSESARKLLTTQVEIATRKLEKAKAFDASVVVLADNRALTQTILLASDKLDDVKRTQEAITPQ